MKRTIQDIDVRGKKVLLRVDFNVPLDDSGNILDASRISAELPTIKYLLAHDAKVIICSHLGRPKGEPNPKLSMVSVAKYLVGILHCKVRFSPQAVGKVALNMVEQMEEGEILVLENIRFYKEEEDNSPVFASKLAELADIYVNDAFGTAHRKHASTYGVAKLLPNAVGFLMGRELSAINGALNNPKSPFVAILGGAKVSDKIYVIKNLIKKCNTILIGGAMAYTFLKAKGVEIGKSTYEPDCIEVASEILKIAEDNNVKVVLPIDHVCAEVLSPNAKPIKISSQEIVGGFMGLDIGPKTIKLFKKEIKNAQTIIWNGPMGVFEFEHFRIGTKKVAIAVSKCKGTTIVGGGDSIAAIVMLGVAKNITHISTGGGASMKLIGGESLPGVEVITEKR